MQSKHHYQLLQVAIFLIGTLLFLLSKDDDGLSLQDEHTSYFIRRKLSSALTLTKYVDPHSHSIKKTKTRHLSNVQKTLFCGEEPKQTTIFVDAVEPKTPYDGCFISSIFAANVNNADTPFDASSLHEKYPNYAFLMFTNLEELDAKGWKKVLHFDTGKKRMITVSRYPKFLAWKEDFIQE